MPDDLRMPIATGDHRMPGAAQRTTLSSGYRPRGHDGGTRAMVIAAAAIGGILVVGLGSWALMARRPATIPLIEADSRPLRVKPENPGGLQVAGADEGGPSTGAERVAPPPEAPAPQALRAQMQQAAAPPAAPPAPAGVPTGASPLPDTQTRAQQAARPAASAAAPAVAARPPPPTATGNHVQLAAVGTEAAAKAEWQRLARLMPDLLNDRKPALTRTERDGKTIWRIRTGPFPDTADAAGFCAKVKAKGANCTLASF